MKKELMELKKKRSNLTKRIMRLKEEMILENNDFPGDETTVPETYEEVESVEKDLIYVILNEQHNLMEDQKRVLDSHYGSGKWKIIDIPSAGLNLGEMRQMLEDLMPLELVFASPIPAMIMFSQKLGVRTSVLHNDKRVKKELPNGRIIMTVAKEGWEIVEGF